jgi:hypothetical protein
VLKPLVLLLPRTFTATTCLLCLTPLQVDGSCSWCVTLILFVAASLPGLPWMLVRSGWTLLMLLSIMLLLRLLLL